MAKTTNLTDIIDACATVESELALQAERLENTKPDTESESAHLKDLREGYTVARRYVAILRRYQESRRDRRQREQGDRPVEAVFNEEDDDATR